MKTNAALISSPTLASNLPNGSYPGIWSGYEVDVTIGNQVFKVKTAYGIRGINIPCTVTVENGVVTVETE